jgi:hypothetical protein
VRVFARTVRQLGLFDAAERHAVAGAAVLVLVANGAAVEVGHSLRATSSRIIDTLPQVANIHVQLNPGAEEIQSKAKKGVAPCMCDGATELN